MQLRLAALAVLTALLVGCGGVSQSDSNINSDGVKIYHVPSGAFYDATIIDTSRGERWFCTPEEAVANGWRPSQR